MNVPVSSTIPKLPWCRCASTSSEVEPARAISTSWIAAAPLSARWVMTPCSMRAIRHGDTPTLTMWPPHIATTGRPARREAAMRAITSRSARAAS